MTAPEDALTGGALDAWRIYYNDPKPPKPTTTSVLAYCGKRLALGVGVVAPVVIAVVALDQHIKDRKARQSVLKHDGIRPAWGWSL